MSGLSRPVSSHGRSYSSPKLHSHSQQRTVCKATLKYRWEASIPYNWSLLTAVPMEKIEPRRDLSPFEAVVSQRRFVTEMYQPSASNSPTRFSTPSRRYRKSPQRTSTADLPPSFTPESDLIPGPPVPRLLSLLARSKAVTFDPIVSHPNPTTAKILNLSIKLHNSASSTARHYAFPRSQLKKSPSRPRGPARVPFKNKSIEQYLLRFDKKKPPTNRAWAGSQSQSLPRSREASRGDSGWLTSREQVEGK